MRIVLTGGGGGGHFYPILAVADSIHAIAKQERLLAPELYFITDESFSDDLLYEHGLKLKVINTGKMRRYASISNFFDIFRTIAAIFRALLFLYRIYPDVVFGKGGYASFPSLLAARLLAIPVVIHESDTVPGRVNRWAGKFAKRVAVSYPEAAKHFPADAVAWTGNPVRKSIAMPATEGAAEHFHFDPTVPTILVMGGSQGAEKINDVIAEIVPQLVAHYQIIHQTGKKNYSASEALTKVALTENIHKDRYKVFPYLDDLTLRLAAGCSTLVITRAGSALFEIANWGIPAIVIPIHDSQGDHQRENAFAYARAGACQVIEESNIAPHILLEEIERLLKDPAKLATMKTAAKTFSRMDASDLIAHELIGIGLSHEK